jgi:pimeloyl-ACP methyl ester carboxylesterase
MDGKEVLFEIEQRYHALSQAGRWAEALELATREMHRFPYHSQKIVYLWRIFPACRLGNNRLALDLLEEAAANGHWYAGLQDDPDLAPLVGLPEFKALCERLHAMRAKAMAEAIPVLKVLQPDPKFAPYPLLVALHGSQSHAESFAGHWAAAVEHGWLVGLPQSSQAFGPRTYSWNDWAWAQEEVVQRMETLRRAYPVNPQRAVLAGFSQGGGLAAWLALSKQVSCAGLLLVGPFLSDVESLVPLLKAHRPQHALRAFLAAGQRDRYCLGVARRMAELLPQYGIECRLEVFEDLEHSFPVDFESRLPEALVYLCPPEAEAARL